MFEHLDDPDAVTPGHRPLAGVLTRADAIRTRRRWTLVIGSCCLLLAASVGFIFGRPSGQPALSTTDYEFNLVKGPLPIGLAVPTTALIDVQFANPEDGFALAAHDDDVLLASSTDGGSTWQVRNNRLPAGTGPADESLIQMEFVGSTGYLWGAATSNGEPLWVSHDGGATWLRASIGPDVIDVSAIDLDVWALSETSCTPTASFSSCSLTLAQSLDGGRTWTPVEQLPGGVQFTRNLAAPQGELARITKNRAYVLRYASQAGLFAWQLEFTDDAGQRGRSARPRAADPKEVMPR